MRHIIIIPVAIVVACESAAWSLGIQTPGKRVLCVDLMPASGLATAAVTHVAGEGKLGLTNDEIESRRAALEGGFAGGSYPGAMWWRMDDAGVLLASHLRDDEPHLGEPWSFDATLTFAGLKRRKTHPFPHQE